MEWPAEQVVASARHLLGRLHCSYCAKQRFIISDQILSPT
jgi:hypothetical protein